MRLFLIARADVRTSSFRIVVFMVATKNTKHTCKLFSTSLITAHTIYYKALWNKANSLAHGETIMKKTLVGVHPKCEETLCDSFQRLLLSAEEVRGIPNTFYVQVTCKKEEEKKKNLWNQLNINGLISLAERDNDFSGCLSFSNWWIKSTSWRNSLQNMVCERFHNRMQVARHIISRQRGKKMFFFLKQLDPVRRDFGRIMIREQKEVHINNATYPEWQPKCSNILAAKSSRIGCLYNRMNSSRHAWNEFMIMSRRLRSGETP